MLKMFLLHSLLKTCSEKKDVFLLSYLVLINLHENLRGREGEAGRYTRSAKQ